MNLYNIRDDIEKRFILKDTFNERDNPQKKELMDIKCKIDNIKYKEWERCKKTLNNYEYIYTSSKTNKNICGIIPVSRSYFKIYQILKDIEYIDTKGVAACIAEGPGGFIQCLNDNTDMEVHGITLISKEDKTIPFWNQLITNNKNNKLFFCEDNTGDIYVLKNANDFIKTIERSCILVTADGGFDYSNNYNEQENLSYKLIYSEIYICLKVQKIKGSFIIKFFDIFNYKTIQLIYLLYLCYDTITFFKPITSRLSNSEKYIICNGYKGCENYILQILEKSFNNCENFIIDVPEQFINEIIKYNKIFVEKQIKSINDIINFTKKKEKQNIPTPEQIKTAEQWCLKYNLPLNKKCIYL